MKSYTLLAVLPAMLLGAAEANAGPYVDAVLADNPSAYYRFEDASTAHDALAADSSTPNTPAANYKAIPSPIATTTGPILTEASNTALDFINSAVTGETQYVAVKDAATHPTGNYTIEWWAKVEEPHGDLTYPNGGAMVSTYSGVAGGFEVGYNGATDRPYVVFYNHTNGVTVFEYGDPDLTADLPNESDELAPHDPDHRDEWFHYALVIGASNDNVANDFASFYVNGGLNFTRTIDNNGVDPAFYVDGLYIGQQYSGRQFRGQMDEVAVYQSTLSADRIAAHYAAATLPGDFDRDNDVDGDDLAEWKTALGNPGSDADADGDSDGNDFLIWQRNLSQPGAATTVAPVPEPTTALLACVAAGLALVVGLRRSPLG